MTVASGTTGATRGSAQGPLRAVAAAWLVVLVMLLFQLWLTTWLWIFVFAVDALVGMLVLGLVVGAATTLVSRRRYVVATVAAVATGVLLASFVLVHWRPAYANGWYALNLPAFSQIAELARADRLAPVGDRPGTYDLPGTLGIVPVNGRVSWCGRSEGERVLLAPALLSTPDGGAGFVHVVGSRPDSAPDWECDANGDQVRPRHRLGGGWWWAD